METVHTLEVNVSRVHVSSKRQVVTVYLVRNSKLYMKSKNTNAQYVDKLVNLMVVCQ